MADYSAFPAINASLNGTSAILLASGRVLIRRGKIGAHRACMIAAVTASTFFLASYLYYHAHVGSVHFKGQGWVRPLYFTILTSHTILAAIIVPLVIVTLVRGLRAGKAVATPGMQTYFARHRAIARWTYPIWMYVSITGVVIYVMLYHLFA